MATRTRHGQDYWKRHLDRWGKSGQTQIDYCADARISVKTFQRWKSRLANPKGGDASPTPTPHKKNLLIPVRLAPPHGVSAGFDGGRDIRIHFDGGQWVVSVPLDVKAEHLVNVLKAIAGASQ